MGSVAGGDVTGDGSTELRVANEWGAGDDLAPPSDHGSPMPHARARRAGGSDAAILHALPDAQRTFSGGRRCHECPWLAFGGAAESGRRARGGSLPAAASTPSWVLEKLALASNRIQELLSRDRQIEEATETLAERLVASVSGTAALVGESADPGVAAREKGHSGQISSAS